MQTKYFKRILGGLILGLSLLGIGAMSSTTAQAQYPWQTQEQRDREQRQRERELRRQREQQERQGGWYDQYGNYHASNTNTQNGYYDRNGVFHSYSNQNGYYNQNGSYNRNGYYNNNRSGRFNDGYPDLGGSFDLRQTAMNAGFTDGVKAGREDLRRNRGSNVQAHSEYQKATRDYNSSRGDRYLYQQYYRMAFEHGYADGITGH